MCSGPSLEDCIGIVEKKVLILGVTASGKGSLAFELAKRRNAEILSVDSMKVYRRMDIGTAKPPRERRDAVRHWAVDVVEPSEAFSVNQFLKIANEAQYDVQNRGLNLVAVGGTALYIKTMLLGLFDGPGEDADIRKELKMQVRENGLSVLYEKLRHVDPEAAERISANDEKRIVRALEVFELTGKPISSFQTQFDRKEISDDWYVIGLRRSKEEESRRINARVKKMVEMGLVDEVKGLLNEPAGLGPQSACAIGYAEIIDHLNGDIELDKAIERIKINTRRFAKSQRTWYKTFRFVNWIDVEPGDTPETLADRAGKMIESGKKD